MSYTQRTKKTSVSPQLNKSAVKDATPSKRLLNTSPKKSVKSVHEKGDKTQISSRASKERIQAPQVNYYNQKDRGFAETSRSGEPINLFKHLQSISSNILSQQPTTSSGTNNGSLISSISNYVRKDEYISLLNELHKRNQEELNYQMTIKKLELKLDLYSRVVSLCPHCVERMNKSIIKLETPPTIELRIPSLDLQDKHIPLKMEARSQIYDELNQLEGMLNKKLTEIVELQGEAKYLKQQTPIKDGRPPEQQIQSSVFKALTVFQPNR